MEHMKTHTFLLRLLWPAALWLMIVPFMLLEKRFDVIEYPNTKWGLFLILGLISVSCQHAFHFPKYPFKNRYRIWILGGIHILTCTLGLLIVAGSWIKESIFLVVILACTLTAFVAYLARQSRNPSPSIAPWSTGKKISTSIMLGVLILFFSLISLEEFSEKSLFDILGQRSRLIMSLIEWIIPVSAVLAMLFYYIESFLLFKRGETIPYEEQINELGNDIQRDTAP